MMQMRTDYEVYMLSAKACFMQSVNEGNVEVVKELDGMRPAVACAGINQHHTPVNLEDPALKYQIKAVVFVEEIRL
jgi:hypothetical protein